ncbi:MAG TPA: glycoside hydrolase family 2 TIM barrel-domain containing protein [Steroidobacteraceae bacterium]|jgi:beta-glucuronidase|nr:glycoside hydrolase family 2 TIM barrel-domain containing protein [Steroidobacteraceae bacterium]
MNTARCILTLLALQLCATAATTADAATRIDLNDDWAFRTERGTDGVAAGWALTTPAGTRNVSVPHTWNRVGADYDYLGTGWYFRRLDLPKFPADATVQLHFGATFYKARVWVNGVEVGGHEGGYTGHSYDITTRLRDSNLIAVAIDNRPGMFTIPGFGARGAADAWYDWWAYGGIVRDVWLSVHGPVRVDKQFIRSKIEGSKATVTDRVALASRNAQRVTVRATVTDPKGKAVATRQQSVVLREGTNEVSLALPLEQIQRWDLDHPNLYRMSVEVLDAVGKTIEEAHDAFGLREIVIRDRHLLINGQRARLSGMTRHADSPWEGLAETKGTLRHDWEDMKSLNMTVTRPVHYAPDPWVADFADARGILLIPEIPVWQASEAQLSNPQYIELAKRQMRELIEQYGNHPGVFAWSVFNESAAGTPGGIRFFRELRDFIKGIDPERPVTLADDNLPKLGRAEESAANDADFLMMNQYFGAWHGPREALDPALDKVDRLFPNKMVIISEFGFPGIFAKNPAEADSMRVSILREQLPLLAKRDWIAGAILWCYQDYKSRRYFWPGQEQGYLEHGIVDPDRQRKPSYFAWAELNAPAHIEAGWTRNAGGTPAAFALTLKPNGEAELPSYPLRDYRLSWQLIDADGKAFADGAVLVNPEALSIERDVPARTSQGSFKLVIKLLRPDGSQAMERSLASQ